MTAVPSPPAGARVHQALDGRVVAEWDHGPGPGALSVRLHAAGPRHLLDPRGRTTTVDAPPTVDVRIVPHRSGCCGVTDPAELRAMAWLLLAAASWQDRARAAAGLTAPVVPDPQLSLLDLPAAIGAGATT